MLCQYVLILPVKSSLDTEAKVGEKLLNNGTNLSVKDSSTLNVKGSKHKSDENVTATTVKGTDNKGKVESVNNKSSVVPENKDEKSSSSIDQTNANDLKSSPETNRIESIQLEEQNIDVTLATNNLACPEKKGSVEDKKKNDKGNNVTNTKVDVVQSFSDTLTIVNDQDCKQAIGSKRAAALIQNDNNKKQCNGAKELKTGMPKTVGLCKCCLYLICMINHIVGYMSHHMIRDIFEYITCIIIRFITC